MNQLRVELTHTLTDATTHAFFDGTARVSEQDDRYDIV